MPNETLHTAGNTNEAKNSSSTVNERESFQINAAKFGIGKFLHSKFGEKDPLAGEGTTHINEPKH